MRARYRVLQSVVRVFINVLTLDRLVEGVSGAGLLALLRDEGLRVPMVEFLRNVESLHHIVDGNLLVSACIFGGV